MRRSLALFLATAGLLRADALADVKAQLARLTGGDAVKATLEVHTWQQTLEDKKPLVSQGRATAQVEDGPQGVRIGWSRGQLQQAQAEARAQALDPEKQVPTRSAMGALGPLGVSEYLNYAEALLRDFERGQVKLLEERAEPWNGRPARLLVLRMEPKLPESQRKYMKELKVDAKLWVGPDGLPLAYSTAVRFKGSRFFINFEGGNSEDLRFARSGNRLVAVHAVSENRNSGMGQSFQRKNTTQVTLN